MKLLFDFLPIVLFFLAYKIAGIYVATAVAMGASMLQIAWLWWYQREISSMQIITLVLIVLLGGATLIFKNPLFIKWKPTAVYWAFALAFFCSQYIGKMPLIKRMMGQQLSLPAKVWHRLNWAWISFFTGTGLANIIVAYRASENTWVNFKLFGIMGLTLIFVIAQAVFLSKHLKKATYTESP